MSLRCLRAAVACSLLTLMLVPDYASAQSAPALASIRLSKALVAGCKSSSLVVTLTEPAPATGLTVALATSSPLVTVKPTFVIPGGVTTKTIGLKTKPVVALAEVHVSARLNSPRSGRMYSH